MDTDRLKDIVMHLMLALVPGWGKPWSRGTVHKVLNRR